MVTPLDIRDDGRHNFYIYNDHRINIEIIVTTIYFNWRKYNVRTATSRRWYNTPSSIGVKKISRIPSDARPPRTLYVIWPYELWLFKILTLDSSARRELFIKKKYRPPSSPPSPAPPLLPIRPRNKIPSRGEKPTFLFADIGLIKSVIVNRG